MGGVVVVCWGGGWLFLGGLLFWVGLLFFFFPLIITLSIYSDLFL